MSRRNFFWLLGIAAVSLFGIAVSFSAPTREKEKDYELVRLVVDVLHEVDQKYVRKLDDEQKRKLVEDMINGGLERLDPHSAYINPKEYKHFEKTSKGKFGGVGIQIGYDRQNRGQLTVVSPMPGTPAYKARSAGADRILAGDAIVKIEGKSTDGMRINDAVELIQGDPGKEIVLTVQHENGKDPFDITIVRAEIKVQTVLGDLRKPKDKIEEWDFFLPDDRDIGYIRLTGFSEKSSQELVAALKELKKDEKMRGLILDLRNNPGGLLSQAKSVSNLFLKEGERIVSTKGRNSRDEVSDALPEEELLRLIYPDSSEADLRAAAKGVSLQPAARYPMVVLVNKHSASASEIVSAALQDNGRAIIVGERSYGKGSVQNVIVMNKEKDPSALKLTTASYWRPSGKNIHRFPDSKETDTWGVSPNDSGFLLTAVSLTGLRTDGVPDAILDKLKQVPDNRRFPTESEYLAELEKLLGKGEVTKYRGKLIARADRGFEVPMKEEERYEYMFYRSERDVVHDEDKPEKPGEEKKKFKDRVLEKALEYLRKEIKEGKAAVAPPERGNA